MDTPTLIDTNAWPRRQHFEHYRHVVPCTYGMTVELDVTAFTETLGRSSWRTYIAQIWAIATIVNRHDEFKMCLNANGEPATWATVHPSFTVFNAKRETFATVWAPYDHDFARFHEAAAAIATEHSRAVDLFPQGAPPPNTFDVSSLPWVSFTGFNLNVDGVRDHFAPIFTLGRYTENGNQVLLPLAVQMHHAVVDGFHTARFINELQILIADPTWLE